MATGFYGSLLQLQRLSRVVGLLLLLLFPTNSLSLAPSLDSQPAEPSTTLLEPAAGNLPLDLEADQLDGLQLESRSSKESQTMEGSGEEDDHIEALLDVVGDGQVLRGNGTADGGVADIAGNSSAPSATLLPISATLLSTSTQRTERCRPKLDVLFLLDSGAEASTEQLYQEHVRWAVTLVDSLPLEQDAVRVAAAHSAEVPLTDFVEGNFPSAEDISRHEEQQQEEKQSKSSKAGGLKIGFSLRKAQAELFRPDRATSRRQTAKLVVLFTDGLGSGQPLREAKQLQSREHVKVFVLCLGAAGSMRADLLNEVGGREEDLFGPEDLARLREALLTEVERTRACSRIGDDAISGGFRGNGLGGFEQLLLTSEDREPEQQQQQVEEKVEEKMGERSQAASALSAVSSLNATEEAKTTGADALLEHFAADGMDPAEMLGLDEEEPPAQSWSHEEQIVQPEQVQHGQAVQNQVEEDLEIPLPSPTSADAFGTSSTIAGIPGSPPAEVDTEKADLGSGPAEEEEHSSQSEPDDGWRSHFKAEVERRISELEVEVRSREKQEDNAVTEGEIEMATTTMVAAADNGPHLAKEEISRFSTSTAASSADSSSSSPTIFAGQLPPATPAAGEEQDVFEPVEGLPSRRPTPASAVASTLLPRRTFPVRVELAPAIGHRRPLVERMNNRLQQLWGFKEFPGAVISRSLTKTAVTNKPIHDILTTPLLKSSGTKRSRTRTTTTATSATPTPIAGGSSRSNRVRIGGPSNIGIQQRLLIRTAATPTAAAAAAASITRPTTAARLPASASSTASPIASPTTTTKKVAVTTTTATTAASSSRAQLTPSQLQKARQVHVACPPLDLLFLVDSSGSVGRVYEAQKEWLEQILEQIQLDGSGETETSGHRVALIQFAGEQLQRTEWEWDRFRRNGQMMDAFHQVRHLTGTTYVGRAIQQALQLLERRRRQVPTLVILLSDGFSQDDGLQLAQQMRQLPNLQLFALSIGQLSNTEYLHRLVGGDPSHVFVGAQSGDLLRAQLLRRLRCG